MSCDWKSVPQMKGSDVVISNVAGVRRRLTENLKRVRERIEAACERAKRDPAEVRLVAVSKYVEMDVLRQALEIGILDIGMAWTWCPAR